MTALDSDAIVEGTGASRQARRARRVNPLTAYCLAALTVVTVITGHEIANPPAVTVGKVTHTRNGLQSTVQATFKSRTDKAQCPVVHATARDTNSKTLAEVVASPVDGSGVLMKGHPVLYRAVVTLSAKDYREKLKTFNMYVYQQHACAPVAP